MEIRDNILSMEKFKLKKFLEGQGYQWFEDKNGKFRIWIRKSAEISGKLTKKTDKFNGFFFPER